ncbi:uncharacterized protein METZ01_LOCUS435073, partial [marine metagenome]
APTWSSNPTASAGRCGGPQAAGPSASPVTTAPWIGSVVAPTWSSTAWARRPASPMPSRSPDPGDASCSSACRHRSPSNSPHSGTARSSWSAHTPTAPRPCRTEPQPGPSTWLPDSSGRPTWAAWCRPPTHSTATAKRSNTPQPPAGEAPSRWPSTYATKGNEKHSWRRAS